MALLALPMTQTSAPAGPAEAQKLQWSSFDGAKFPYLRWLPEGGAGAAVVCLHGLSGAASDYEQLGERLSADGHAVYAYELRGQGNDPKKSRIGDIRKREHWFADLDSFVEHVREHHPEAPLFLYGESLGSLILMHGFELLQEENRSAVRGLIYGSPAVALPGGLGPFKRLCVNLLIRFCPGIKVSLKRLAGDHSAQVTGEGEVDHWEQMEQTPHAVTHWSFRLLGTIEDMIKNSTQAAAPIEKPLLVLYPGKDVFTTPAQVEAFYDELRSKDKSKRLFADSHHLLFYDDEREDLFKLVRQWVGKRAK